MSEQTKHALVQAAIMVALGALVAFANYQTQFLTDAIGSQAAALWGPIIAAAVAALIRWLEGIRDAKRASEGLMVPADVGFEQVKAMPYSTPQGKNLLV